jgi:hypothetical protein
MGIDARVMCKRVQDESRPNAIQADTARSGTLSNVDR